MLLRVIFDACLVSACVTKLDRHSLRCHYVQNFDISIIVINLRGLQHTNIDTYIYIYIYMTSSIGFYVYVIWLWLAYLNDLDLYLMKLSAKSRFV